MSRDASGDLYELKVSFLHADLQNRVEEISQRLMDKMGELEKENSTLDRVIGEYQVKSNNNAHKATQLRVITQHNIVTPETSSTDVSEMEKSPILTHPSLSKHPARVLPQMDYFEDQSIASMSPESRPVTPAIKDAQWTPVSCYNGGPVAKSGSPVSRLATVDVRMLSKSGWLLKQGGSFKNWKKRFFVLQNRNLFYFRTKEDAEEKRALPLGVIPLSSYFSISRCSFSSGVIPKMLVKRSYMFMVETLERTWYLCASTEAEQNEWIHLLQEILRGNQRLLVMSRFSEENTAILAEGWLEKHTKGVVKKRWCVLKHNSLIYYRHSSDEAGCSPCGVIPIDSDTCAVELVPPQDDDSDHDFPEEESLSAENALFTFANLDVVKAKVNRFGLKTSSTTHWFKCDSERDMEMWIYALLSLCPLSSTCRTSFETLISSLSTSIIDHHGDYNLEDGNSIAYLDSVIQREPILRRNFEPTILPLTSLPTDRLIQESNHIHKAIQLFATTALNFEKLEYHYGLVRALLESCLANPMLQNELLLQLTKQTTVIERLFDINELVNTWKLFSIALGIFMPVREAYQYLRLHLVKTMATYENEIVGDFAYYCLRLLMHALEGEPISESRVVVISNRRFPPSQIEMNAVLATSDTPKPMRVLVECLNGATLSVPFEPFTTVKQCKEIILTSLALGRHDSLLPAEHFGLYLRLPLGRSKKQQKYEFELLHEDSFTADAVYQHEAALRKLPLSEATSQLPMFVLKVRLFLPNLEMPKTFHQRKLLLLNAPPTPPPSPLSHTSESSSSRSVLSRLSAEKQLLMKPFKLDDVNMHQNLLNMPDSQLERLDRIHKRVFIFLQKGLCTEKLFVAYQMSELVDKGNFPLSKTAAIGLCALLAQATWGDHYPLIEKSEHWHLNDALERFFPMVMRQQSRSRKKKKPKSKGKSEHGDKISFDDSLLHLYTSMDRSIKNLPPNDTEIPDADSDDVLMGQLSTTWVSLRGMGQEDALNVYLSHTLVWPWGFWSKMYSCMVEAPWWGKKKLEVLLLAVGWDGLCLLKKEDFQPVQMVQYPQIVYYGEADEKRVSIMVQKDIPLPNTPTEPGSPLKTSPTNSPSSLKSKQFRLKLPFISSDEGKTGSLGDLAAEKWTFSLIEQDASGTELVDRIKTYFNLSIRK